MPRYPPLKIVVHEAVHLQGRLNDSQRAIATSDSSHSCKDNAWCCHTLQYTQRVQRVFGSSRHLQIASQTCHGHQIHRKQISVGKRGGQHLKTRKRQNDGQITVPNEPKIVFFFSGEPKTRSQRSTNIWPWRRKLASPVTGYGLVVAGPHFGL